MLRKMIDFWYSKMEGKYLSRMGHFTTGFMISTIAGHLVSLLIGLIAAVIAGMAKEWIDKESGKGEVSFVAFLLTALGGLLAYTILGI
ncbi:hypothetical protein [Pelosinus propionicus]|uniref:Uncharacterized protein n=1 Tax=Pelosinus propionicus DSM 13327 TaxID=1123291 RepID=A0A1I4N050_9FIRM|nr:hypothetical protein [Pelosinus propionicus]SFM08954.1 hypothetical protein SAMN04490355_10406 [Pelosinus propionicus DSM 13327]